MSRSGVGQVKEHDTLELSVLCAVISGVAVNIWKLDEATRRQHRFWLCPVYSRRDEFFALFVVC